MEHETKKHSVIWIVGAVLLWRVALSIVVFCSTKLPYRPTFPYADNLIQTYNNRSLTTWAQFDGVHYLTIVEKGYKGTGLIQAFFPLYPFLIYLITWNHLNPIWIGVALSTLSFGFGLVLLYKLLIMDEGDLIAKRTIVGLLLSPVSFYFTALYTEGLFFLLLVSSFYFARKQQWGWASIIGIFAAATRLVGIFLIPALLYEFWQQRKQLTHKHAVALLPLLGLGGYMVYLQRVFHDAFLFLNVQESFGTERSTDKFILLYQVFYRYIKMLFTVNPLSRTYYIVTQEFLAGLIGLIGLIIGWFSVRRSYIIFCVGAYFIPTLTGTFSSLPRYLLPLFPLVVVAAKMLPRWAYTLFLIITSCLLIINVVMFTQGLWIA